MNIRNDFYQLLGSRLKMLSANSGYRASIDPVLLAASVPAKPGQRVLDVGCGTGVAAFCLVTRMPGLSVMGFDFQLPLILLANKIASLNGLEKSTRFIDHDLLEPLPHLLSGSFDHVVANPPHLKFGSGNRSPDYLKFTANVEGKAKLKDWVVFCFRIVVEGGTVTFVHRYDRKDELISLSARFGLVKVLPLWPKIRGIGAKRVLIQVTKGAREAIRTNTGIVLHTDQNDYTPEARSILEDAKSLNI